MVSYIDFETMRQVCHRLAVTFFDKLHEPISPFVTVDRHLLESALGAPRAGYGTFEKYPTIESKAAALLHSLIKDHPFPNGNKRIAVVTVFVFLYANGWLLTTSNESLVRYALRIARSDPRQSERVIRNATRWIKRKLVAK